MNSKRQEYVKIVQVIITQKIFITKNNPMIPFVTFVKSDVPKGYEE